MFQVSVVIAAFTFFQRQEPQLERTIDHETKVLNIGRAGYAPISIKIYAVVFEIPLLKDAGGHPVLNPTVPIEKIYTRGRILEQTLWLPWSSITVDLRRFENLEFRKWIDELVSPMKVYCLAIEARNRLSNQSVVETVLTDGSLFSASMFGPVGAFGAMGGGYNSTLFAAERLMNSECRALYEKMRF